MSSSSPSSSISHLGSSSHTVGNQPLGTRLLRQFNIVIHARRCRTPKASRPSAASTSMSALPRTDAAHPQYVLCDASSQHGRQGTPSSPLPTRVASTPQDLPCHRHRIPPVRSLTTLPIPNRELVSTRPSSLTSARRRPPCETPVLPNQYGGVLPRPDKLS
ncbi:hypothetical protein LZ32DRAFT_260307 [Colletotrichum eremochloae]|nr:hypothetical protein LZ32DRAFT_260307 [Colletotrichum eremochloae]